jgi:hypothetical protein
MLEIAFDLALDEGSSGSGAIFLNITPSRRKNEPPAIGHGCCGRCPPLVEGSKVLASRIACMHVVGATVIATDTGVPARTHCDEYVKREEISVECKK